MKFLIITTFGSKVIEAEDIEEAVQYSYDDHTGYDNVLGVVNITEKN